MALFPCGNAPDEEHHNTTSSICDSVGSYGIFAIGLDRYGKVIEFTLQTSTGVIPAYTWCPICTLKSKYRPKTEIIVPAVLGVHTDGRMRIAINGVVDVYQASGASDMVASSATYISA